MLLLVRVVARTRAARWTYYLLAIVPSLLLGMTFLEEAVTEGWGGIGVAFGYLLSGASGLALAVAGIGLYAAADRDRRFLGASLIAAVPTVLLGFRMLLVSIG